MLSNVASQGASR